MSKFTEAIKELSEQPKQEQDLLAKGVELLKKKFERPKAPKKEVGRTL